MIRPSLVYGKPHLLSNSIRMLYTVTMNKDEFYRLNKAPKRSKYNSKKTFYDGVEYDSKKEADYAAKLDLLRKATDPHERVVRVERQVAFILQDKFTDATGKKHLPIKYFCDFLVNYADGRQEIVDVKSFGTMTDVYKIKKKLLLFKYRDISFREEI